MGREDIDVSREMRRILSDEGMRVFPEAQLLEVRGRSGDKVMLVVRTPSGEQNIDGSDILVAVGRIPNTSGIGLEDAGVELDGRGYIRVNDRLETSAPGGANGDHGGAAISEARQRRPGPPDNGRRSQHALLKHTASVGSADHARKSRIGSEFRLFTPPSMHRPRI